MSPLELHDSTVDHVLHQADHVILVRRQRGILQGVPVEIRPAVTVENDEPDNVAEVLQDVLVFVGGGGIEELIYRGGLRKGL